MIPQLITLIKDYGPMIAWGLVIVGWHIANRHANVREKRKDLRAEIDRVEELLDTLVAAYRTYWTNLPGSPSDAESARIKAGINRMGMILDRICAHLLSPDLQRLQAALFERLTGGEFESQARTMLEHNHPSMLSADIAAAQLMDALERAYGTAKGTK